MASSRFLFENVSDDHEKMRIYYYKLSEAVSGFGIPSPARGRGSRSPLAYPLRFPGDIVEPSPAHASSDDPKREREASEVS